jgi:hypothetical protein
VVGDLVEGRIIDEVALRRLDVPVDAVPGAPVPHGERGEVAEHILAHRVERRVSDVVRLTAVDVADAIGGLAVLVLHAHVLLLADLVVRTRREFHIDRGAGDHVLVVAGRQ